jgi:predicted nuclease with TOPRIM domain
MDKNNTTEQEQDSKTVDPQEQDSKNSSEQDSNETTRNKLTYEQLEEKLRKANADAAEKRVKLKRFEDEQQQREEQRLKEQGDFQKLAEQHKARIEELEPKVAEHEELVELWNERLKLDTKDWPDSVKKLLAPTKDLPMKARIKQVADLQLVVNEMQTQQRGSQPGNSPSPKPAGQQTPDDIRRTFEQRLRASSKYSA